LYCVFFVYFVIEGGFSMLKQVLEEFEKSDGVLSLEEMAARLGVERSALEGMIEFWVRKGRLRQVGPDGGDCARCAGCYLASNVERGKSYALVQSGEE
jgi:hypothetical protein